MPHGDRYCLLALPCVIGCRQDVLKRSGGVHAHSQMGLLLLCLSGRFDFMPLATDREAGGAADEDNDNRAI